MLTPPERVLKNKITPTTTSAAGHLRPFMVLDAHELIRDARPGEVHVVTAAPGQGKSRAMRLAIQEALDPASGLGPRLHRVLWATHSIATETALGAEALEKFTRLSVQTQIVYGKDNFAALGIPGRYEDQFKWPTDASGRPEPMVKIISHARLRQIFGASPGAALPRLSDADLLVIDEDPTSGLLLSSPTTADSSGSLATLDAFRLESLARSGDAVCLALHAIIRRTEASSPAGSAIRNFALWTGYDIGHGLYDEEFWKLFQLEHPAPVDVASFSDALKLNNIDDALLIAEQFAEDARCARGSAGVPPRFRTRFGVHWIGRVTKPDWARMALFRFNLRKPLTLSLPVIVLDGYAHAKQYEALFLEQDVKIHEFTPALRLVVECSELMVINPLDVATEAKGLAHRLHVAEELAGRRAEQLRADPVSKQVILTSKALHEPISGWQKSLRQAYSAQGLPFQHLSRISSGGVTEPDQLYWHAGRGLDAYNGADIYALTLPKLSELHRDYTLAAILLDDAPLRQKIQDHARASELLQMLNRGRQPAKAAAGGPVPRIIVGASTEKVEQLLGDLADQVSLVEYVPLLQLVKGSSNPRWRDATTALARELLALPEFKHGLPSQLLECLPTHSEGEPNQARTATAVKLAALAASSAPQSNLYRAFHDRINWRYKAVLPGGGGNSTKMLDEAMGATGLELIPLKTPSATGQSKVYVRPGGTAATARAAARAAYAAFDGWLRPVAPPDIGSAPLRTRTGELMNLDEDEE